MREAPPGPLSVLARVPLAAVQRGGALLADLQADKPAATELFTAGAGTSRADRAALADILVDQQARWGAGEAALAQARRLADPATPVVTVGQQPGLLTGPLYTIYKALTALTLARRHGGVPVFWVGADDDDRAEIDHCGLWDAGEALHPIHYPCDAGAPGMLVGDLPAGDAAEAVLAGALPLLRDLPHGAAAEGLLRATLAGSADLGAWFARLLARLFARWGLVLCDPRDPALRRLALPVLRAELARPLETTRRLRERAAELRRRGYPPALTKPEHVVNLFRYDGHRQRISFTDGAYAIDGVRVAPAALRAAVDDDPGGFVPNAVLRPVVQEYLFGSLAFVAGPHEAEYWAELAPVFAALDVRMPAVVIRAGATLVPRRHARRLRQWEIAPLDLLVAYDRLRLTLLDAAGPDAVREAFALSRAELGRVAARLAQAVAGVEPTLAAAAAAAHQRMAHELERLERKTRKAIERGDDDLTARLAATREALFPHGGLQERALNVCSLIGRYGEGIIAQLVELLDGEEGQHLFVEI